MIKYFVWIEGLKGPEAQIWDEKDKTVDGKPIKKLAIHELSENDPLQIYNLTVIYPIEAKS